MDYTLTSLNLHIMIDLFKIDRCYFLIMFANTAI